jgi:ribosomal protein S19
VSGGFTVLLIDLEAQDRNEALYNKTVFKTKKKRMAILYKYEHLIKSIYTGKRYSAVYCPGHTPEIIANTRSDRGYTNEKRML